MSSLILENNGLVGLENDVLVGLENNSLIGLENDSLVGLQNNNVDCDGLAVAMAMVVNDNCEFIFEDRPYQLYTDYVQARRSWTAGIFANSGMLAARLAIAEERTTAGPRRVKNPRDDLLIPPLLPQRKSSRIARKVNKDYNKGIVLAEYVRSDVSFDIRGALTRTGPFIRPTHECQISRDEVSSSSITSSQLTMYRLLTNVSSPLENWENQINHHG